MRIEAIHNLAMVPVRGAVNVVKLPFVFLWKVVLFLYICVYTAVAAVVGVPVHYCKKLHNRVVFVWNWTKSTVQQTMGYNNRPAIAGTPLSVQPGDYLTEVVPRHPRALAWDNEDPPIYPSYGAYGRPRHGKGRRKDRKALISHLIRLLLEPSSPCDSEDESERSTVARHAPMEQDEAEKALSLILDLVKLSKATQQEHAYQQEPKLQPQDLASLLRQTKDKDMLQALITELDQLAIDVDPAILLKARPKKLMPRPIQDSSTHALIDSERASSVASSVDTAYTPNPSSAVSSSDEYADATSGECELDDMDVPIREPYKPGGALSPVQESPEYISTSSESLCYLQLEKDLNNALSKLTTEASGLKCDQAALESLETEITQKTVTITEGIPVEINQKAVQDDDLSSVPKTDPILGLQVGRDRRDLANARKTRPPTRKTVAPLQEQQVPTDGKIDSIPQAHSIEQAQEEDHDDFEDAQSDCSDVSVYEEATGNEDDDNESDPGTIMAICSRALPLQLTDQIHLLTAGSPAWENAGSDDGTEPDDPSDLTNFLQIDTSDKKPDLEPTVPSESEQRNVPDPCPVVFDTQRSRRGSSSSDVGSEKNTLLITSSQPPWIEMVERRNRTANSNSSSSATTPTHSNSSEFPIIVYKPPVKTKVEVSSDSDPTPKVSDTESAVPQPNIWGNSRDDDIHEGLYDTLLPKPATTDCLYDTLAAPPKYLHEKIAAAQKVRETISVEPSPRLPPRNLSLKHKSSAEIGSPATKTRRHSSEGLSKSTHVSKSAEKEPHKSRSRDKDSDERKSREKEPRETRSKDKERREHHSRESSSSRHRSHSAERRSGSQSEHRHSSDRHRSHSGDRHKSHSGDRHRSHSGDRSSSRTRDKHSSSHRSPTEKHRSHSTEKHSSRPSSRPSSTSTTRRSSSSHSASSSSKKPLKDSEEKSEPRWKILASPSLSRSRLATALFSKSSTKESPSTKSSSDKDNAHRKRSSSLSKDKDKVTSHSKSSESKSSSKSRSASSSSKSPKSKSSDATSSRKVESASSNRDKESSPEIKDGMSKSSSLSSIQSAGACSVYSFDSLSFSGKQTEI